MPPYEEMMKDMSTAKRPHLKGFVNFVKADLALAKAAKNEDCAAFVSRYNGPTYKENDYDTKMKNNFEAFEKADAAKNSKG